MQLQRLAINNFLRIQDMDLDLTGTTVHLFAGPNEAGKSSLQEAIRFAVSNETLRVKYKKDYKAMIRDGTKKGFVVVNTDAGYVKRNIADGKGDGNLDPPLALAYTLDAPAFAHLDAVERRKFLFQALGVKTSTDMVKQRLTKEGVQEQLIEQVIPMLRGGFESAHKEAKSQISELRGAWQGLTKEKYGSQKAENWTAPKPDFNERDLKHAEADLEDVDNRINELYQKVGQASEQAKQMDDLEAKANSIDDIKKHVETLKQEVTEAESTEQYLVDKCNVPEGIMFDCPECGTALVYSQGEAKKRTGKGRSKSEAEEAKAQLQTARQVLNDKRQALTVAENDFKGAQEAAEKLKAMEAPVQDEEAQHALDELRHEKQATQARADELRATRNQLQEADRITNEAYEYHQALKDWETIAALLAHDGLPGELLASALDPVNKRLRHSAEISGWRQVAIAPDMAIAIDGRPYELQSESARWRADAALTEAIAYLSGVKLFVLDRLDVLDLPNRASLVKWLDAISADHDTILVMGTLKQAPTGLPASIQVYWMEEGNVEEVA